MLLLRLKLVALDTETNYRNEYFQYNLDLCTSDEKMSVRLIY